MIKHIISASTFRNESMYWKVQFLQQLTNVAVALQTFLPWSPATSILQTKYNKICWYGDLKHKSRKIHLCGQKSLSFKLTEQCSSSSQRILLFLDLKIKAKIN